MSQLKKERMHSPLVGFFFSIHAFHKLDEAHIGEDNLFFSVYLLKC